MEFFKRILGFDEKTLAREEQRLSQRFTISPLAPLSARLQVSGIDYPVTLRDLSTLGAGIHVDSFIDLHQGLNCQISLQAESVAFSLNANVARIISASSGSIAGLDLTDNEYDVRRCLVQLLEPISMGATLKRVDPEAVSQTESDLIALRYYSSQSSTLTVWRRTSDDSINGFEIHIQDYFIRSTAQAKSADFGSLTLRQNDEETQELRRLFNWIALHLPPQIPDDLSDFLQGYRTDFGT